MRRILLISLLVIATLPVFAQKLHDSSQFGDVASSVGEDDTLLVMPILPTNQLSKSEKFHRFVTQSTDPGNFLGAGVEAGLSQISHDNLGFGQGADGFGKRYGAAVADRASLTFFSQYALPVAFHQDPRYYRLGDGGFSRRFWYAGTRAFIGKRDTGTRMTNYSIIGGAFLSAGLANTYYPQGERTLGFTLRSGALNIGSVIGANLGREFWPDIKAKLFGRKEDR